jgi:Uma2 family endonuclease
MAEEAPMRSTLARPDTRLTYADFLRFPDDGKRHEIIDGVHHVTPSPGLRHQDLVGRLHLAIASYLAAHPEAGRVFLSPLDVVLSPYDVVEPDLLFVTRDQAHILSEKNVQGPPALVVEVLSRGTRRRDAQAKRQLFERAGVREYWMVDSERRVVQVLRKSADGRLVREAELAARDDDVLATPLLPGCAIGLSELFRESI